MTILAEDILDNIVRYGVEFYRVYPGLYRGIVKDNADPQKQGRVKVHVPSMQDEAVNIWIKCAMQGAGDGRGIFWPPEVGDPVYVSFAQGQPSRPECYIGGWWARRDDVSDVPDDLGYSGNYPDKRGFVTRWGHKLLFIEEDGGERVELTWNKPNPDDEARTDRTKTAGAGSGAEGGGSASLTFSSDGSVQITDNSTPAQTVTMDATQGTIEIADKSGNKVVLSSTGARIEATAIDIGGSETVPSTEPVIKGQSWFNWAIAHTHTAPTGPTGPPSPPGPILTPSVLSQKAKVS